MDKQTEVSNVHWGRDQKKNAHFCCERKAIINKHISSKLHLISRQGSQPKTKSLVFPFKRQVLLNTVEKKSHGKRRKSKRMQKFLGSFEQNSICRLLSFKSQKCKKKLRTLRFGVFFWVKPSQRSLQQHCYSFGRLWMWRDRKQTGKVALWACLPIYDTLVYSCFLFSVILWYHWHQSSFICEYGRGMRKKNGQRYNTTFLSSGTSHNTVWDCAKETDRNYSVNKNKIKGQQRERMWYRQTWLTQKYMSWKRFWPISMYASFSWALICSTSSGLWLTSL